MPAMNIWYGIGAQSTVCNGWYTGNKYDDDDDDERKRERANAKTIYTHK